MTRQTAAGIPVLGLGTFGRVGEAGTAAILTALELGYRHLDTAQSYNTEARVGEAVRLSGLPRSEVFITTKVADTNLKRRDFMSSVERSLETIDIDYLDLLLIHWPSARDAVRFEDYMLALAETKRKGWARRIGVSNYPIADIQRSETLLGEGALSTNQVELHPFLQAPKLCAYSRNRGITLTAYMPLAKGRVSKEPLLQRIGRRHGVTAATVSLAFLIAEGHIVIPASSNPTRLRENLAATNVSLNDDDMEAIRAINRNERIINPEKAPRWDD